MATIDMTQRKLNFPPRFLPYLEKHRIFELFHECVELLVQMKPRDHVTFLKNVLPCAAKKKDKQRIVFLAPNSFDRKHFTELLAECLGIQAIDLDFLKFLTREKILTERLDEEVTSESLEEESCICPAEGEMDSFKIQSPSEMFRGEEDDVEETEEEKEKHKVEEEEIEIRQEDYIYSADEENMVAPEEVKEVQEIKEVPDEKKKRKEEECICVCPCDPPAQEEETEEIGEEVEEEEENEKVKEYESKGTESEYEFKSSRRATVAAEKEGTEAGGESEVSVSQDKLITPSVVKYDEYETTSRGSEEPHINYEILANCEQSAKGWILEDFPKSGEEAKNLNAIGIIPTHAIRIIVNEQEEDKDIEYKTLVKAWMAAYKYVPVTEIQLKNRTTCELVSDMCNLLSVMPHRHAPMLPRIVLIGSRGSGVTTQGNKLSRKYGLVHVEFELVIARALQQDDDLCKLYKTQLATTPDPELEAVLLERTLLTSKCCNRGWVLTGYPTNIHQMRMLDFIATPPNRVIFIEVPPRECFVRLYYRKMDPCSGIEYKIPDVLPAGVDMRETPNLDPKIAKRLLPHPKNDKKQIIHDIEEYFVKKQEMMLYCGKTASYVNGDQTIDRVAEQIEQIIVNSSPPHPPRDPLMLRYDIDESYKRLKEYRLKKGLFLNNLLLNPP